MWVNCSFWDFKVIICWRQIEIPGLVALRISNQLFLEAELKLLGLLGDFELYPIQEFHKNQTYCYENIMGVHPFLCRRVILAKKNESGCPYWLLPLLTSIWAIRNNYFIFLYSNLFWGWSWINLLTSGRAMLNVLRMEL